MSISEAEQLQDLQERWKAIEPALDDMWESITDGFPLTFAAMMRIVSHFAGMIQRAYLCELLPQWIPEAIRAWLARHWPKALLPELAQAIEWMKAEATEQ